MVRKPSDGRGALVMWWFGRSFRPILSMTVVLKEMR